MDEPKTIKGFKGFDKNLQCKGFQFEAGKTFEHKGEIEVCKSGFHFCTNPLDVLKYYGPATSEYHEVEGSGEIQGHKEDSKQCVSELTVGAKATLNAMISLGVKMFIEESKEKTKPTARYSSPSATARYSSPSATAGDYSPSATAGDYSPSATAGDYSPSATARYSSPSATAGNYSHSATAGDSSPSATAGDYSHSATAGNYSHSATAGDYSPSATARKNSIACAIGKNSKVKSTLGNWIVASEYDAIGNVLSVKAAKIDGEKLKPDVWYIVKSGELVEAE